MHFRHNRRSMEAAERIRNIFRESIKVQTECIELLAPPVAVAARAATQCLLADHKIMACGNGGSAAQAQHFSSEMLNRFEIERPGLPAIALTTDSSTLTSIANDYDFADVYAKQILALGQPGDLLICFSTSGDSPNVVNAIGAAHKREVKVVMISGREGGEATGMLADEDIEIRVPHWSTARIQEVHLMVTHCLCDLIDQQLLGSGSIDS